MAQKLLWRQILDLNLFACEPNSNVHNLGFISVGKSFRKNESIYALQRAAIPMASNWKNTAKTVCVFERMSELQPNAMWSKSFAKDHTASQPASNRTEQS